MSNFYNTQGTQLFSSKNVLTGIVLQHRGKCLVYPFFKIGNRKLQMKFW